MKIEVLLQLSNNKQLTITNCSKEEMNEIEKMSATKYMHNFAQIKNKLMTIAQESFISFRKSMSMLVMYFVFKSDVQWYSKISYQ